MAARASSAKLKSSATEKVVEVKEADMPEDMLQDAIETAKFALEKFKEKEVDRVIVYLINNIDMYAYQKRV